MKIFAVRDEIMDPMKDLAYLFYYELDKKFFIELPEDADEWKTPLILSSFAKKGEKSINSYWSKIWVQQRIVPTDRQNIGQILKNHGLKEYDEYKLLVLSEGRCAQDDYFLVPITEAELPKIIQKRLEKRIEDIIPLSNFTLLVFFQNGVIKKCHLDEYFSSHLSFRILLERAELFSKVEIQIGGHGVYWDENLAISSIRLYNIGTSIPLKMEDFVYFSRCQVVNAAEAAKILDCSRQYINELTKKGELHPIKSSEKNTLYLKSELVKRRWH